MNYMLTSAGIGLALAACILVLVRRDHLYFGQAMFWILVAGAAVAFGLFPRLSDRLATVLGIGYGPTLVLSVGLAIAFAKALLADLAATRLQRDLHVLAQRLAVAETLLREREKAPVVEGNLPALGSAPHDLASDANATADCTRQPGASR